MYDNVVQCEMNHEIMEILVKLLKLPKLWENDTFTESFLKL